MSDIDEMLKDWPEKWSFSAADRAFGVGLAVEMRPFVEFLVEKYAKSTVNRHLNNLFLLGGEIIREVMMDEEYDADSLQKLRDSVEEEGGLLCQHLHTDAEQRSYDATCRKLHRLLNK